VAARAEGDQGQPMTVGRPWGNDADIDSCGEDPHGGQRWVEAEPSSGWRRRAAPTASVALGARWHNSDSGRAEDKQRSERHSASTMLHRRPRAAHRWGLAWRCWLEQRQLCACIEKQRTGEREGLSDAARR
jgi:hypothetical protein